MWWNRNNSIDVLTSGHADLGDEGETPALTPVAGGDVDLESPAQPHQPGRSVNGRFFLVMLAMAIVIFVGVHLLHAYQMQRISSVFFRSAQKAAKADEPHDAIRYIRQYLNFHPKDLDARILLAEQHAKVVQTPRQILNLSLLYESILRTDPEQSTIRRDLVDLYLQSGEQGNAISHLNVLLREQPEDPELFLKIAECYEATADYDQAATVYRQLTRLTPRDARVYERLAFLLHDRLDRPEAADELIQDLMDSNQRNALAYGVRARYRYRFGELKHAARDARIAYQLAPENTEILKLVATILTDQLKAGQESDFLPTEIRTTLVNLVTEHPEDQTAVKVLINLDLAMGRSDLAEERLRELLKANPRDVMTRFQLADLLLVTNRNKASRTEIKHFRETGSTGAAVDFLEARTLMAEKKWLQAIRILENVHFNTAEDPELASSVYQHLGQCYEQIGHLYRRVEAYRKAVKASPRSVDARLGLASALARSGHVEEAFPYFEGIEGIPAASLAKARLSLLKQLMFPPDERDWDAFDSALDQAAREKADVDDLLKLRVLGLVSQNQLELARKQLGQERAKRPNSLSVWLLSAQLEKWADQTQAANEILQTAKKRLGESVELELAQLRLQVTQSKTSNADWVLDQLESWDNLPENYRLPALNELASGLEESSEDASEALKLRLEMAALAPDDLRAWQKVFRLALAAENDETAQKAIGEIRRIEGDSGPYWRLAEADRCLMHGRKGDTALDTRARTLLKDLRNRLPSDWTIPLRLAEIAERQENIDQAIEQFKVVLDLEMYHPQVVRRLVMLLSSKGRDSEADLYLGKLRKSQPRSFSSRYGQVAAVVALKSQHRIKALELAREAVKADSQNPKDHLWLGQILMAIGLRQEAETSLRKSIELAPKQTAARVALIRLLEKTDRHEKAIQEIQELEQHVPAENAGLPRAYCLEMTGQFEAADQAYQDFVKAEPQNGYRVWVLADFYLRTDRGTEAESLLRGLLDPSRTWENIPVSAVRRSLVGRLMLTRSYPASEEALGLLELSLRDNPNSIAELRMKAHLLAERSFRPDRLKALAVFDQLAEMAPLSTPDQIQKIGLLNGLGRTLAAREAVGKLLVQHPEDPQILQFGISHMIEWGIINDATQGWLRRLQQEAPHEFSTISLTARHMVADGKVAEAAQLLESWKSREPDAAPEAQLSRLEQVAFTLMKLTDQQDQLGKAQMADKLGTATERALAELIVKKPERITWKVRFLTNRWQLAEAWELLDQAWKIAPAPEVASVAVSLLQKSREDQRRYETIRGPLEAALRAQPTAIDLEMSAATIAQLCGEYDLAITLYRSVLKKNPSLTVAQNELVNLLALRGTSADHAEALKLIDLAIKQTGPLHFLLDTKATVLLAMGHAEDAIPLLTRAIADTPSSSKYFHLMKAYSDLDSRQDVQRVYRTAMAKGFSIAKLHPLEQAGAHSLVRDMQRN